MDHAANDFTVASLTLVPQQDHERFLFPGFYASGQGAAADREYIRGMRSLYLLRYRLNVLRKDVLSLALATLQERSSDEEESLDCGKVGAG